LEGFPSQETNQKTAKLTVHEDGAFESRKNDIQETKSVVTRRHSVARQGRPHPDRNTIALGKDLPKTRAASKN